MGSRLHPHEQAAAICQELEGEAKQVIRNMDAEKLHVGGRIPNGDVVGPVEYIVETARHHFAPSVSQDEQMSQSKTCYVATDE